MHIPIIRNRTGPRHLLAEPLSRVAFQPYGDVLGDRMDFQAGTKVGTSGRPINANTAIRYDNLLGTDVLRDGGTPCLALFRTSGEAHRGPYRLRELERHSNGSQTFIPLRGSRCLAVVTRGAAQPELDAMQAFVVEPGQAFTIAAGTWHHPLLTIGSAEVLVLERHGATPDCEIYKLGRPFIVTLPGA